MLVEDGSGWYSDGRVGGFDVFTPPPLRPPPPSPSPNPPPVHVKNAESAFL